MGAGVDVEVMVRPEGSNLTGGEWGGERLFFDVFTRGLLSS